MPADQSATQVLLIEDDDGHAWLAQAAMQRLAGIDRIRRLRDGREAMGFIRGGSVGAETAAEVALIVLDLNLPGVDGFGILQELQTDSRYRHVPVVILTTSSEPEDRQRCAELGCRAYLRKNDALLDADYFAQQIADFLPRDEAPAAPARRAGCACG